jgi:hypothetical protein
MTDAQKVQLGQLIEADVAGEARARSLENLKQSPSATNVALGEPPKRTVDDVAAKVGLGSGR